MSERRRDGSTTSGAVRWSGRDTRRLATGLAFIGPNVAGFLVFTLFPLVFSFVMAFSNWDLRLHNMFKPESVRFVGLENFARLFSEPDFLKYLGNTLFLMMAIPFSVAGSLFAAILLSQDLRGGSRQTWLGVLLCVTLLVSAGTLVVVGAGATAMTVLVVGLAGAILFGGVCGGQTTHRTLFYFPHFTAGVATFLLWKKLYSPHTGPVNNALRPLLDAVGAGIAALPPAAVQAAGWLCAGAVCVLLVSGALRLRRMWYEGELGWLALGLGSAFLLSSVVLWPLWTANGATSGLTIPAGIVAAVVLASVLARRREFATVADRGLGHALIVCGGLMVLQLALLGLGNVLWYLPEMSADGLRPPEWLTEYRWAKPSIMIMGFWAAIGSNNMLLYLAGLSNIPLELYEAADIDGASRVQRFWNVTWPQLAPVTFFILVMAVIHGLQGGFEMARTMTRGGPAGATTTLSYYVYTEGFETGRLGYASAVAWTLFALVFCVTLFNWKFGNRYTND